MSDTLTYLGELTVLTCWCGMRHAVPSELRRYQMRQHNDGARDVVSIYCPLGHSHAPAGKGAAEKERERAELLERRLANAQEDARAARASEIATKGQMTRLKKRTANGVCPCCKRHFVNVQRHMAGQHPGFVAAPGPAGDADREKATT